MWCSTSCTKTWYEVRCSCQSIRLCYITTYLNSIIGNEIIDFSIYWQKGEIFCWIKWLLVLINSYYGQLRVVSLIDEGLDNSMIVWIRRWSYYLITKKLTCNCKLSNSQLIKSLLFFPHKYMVDLPLVGLLFRGFSKICIEERSSVFGELVDWIVEDRTLFHIYHIEENVSTKI